jgi:hypothetical protein
VGQEVGDCPAIYFLSNLLRGRGDLRAIIEVYWLFFRLKAPSPGPSQGEGRFEGYY